MVKEQEDIQRLKVTIRIKPMFTRRDENVKSLMKVFREHEMLEKIGSEFQDVSWMTEDKGQWS